MIVLDTHAWVWWLTKPERVGKKAMRALKGADRIGLPSLSIWEVSMKAEKGKLKFDRPYERWIEDAIFEDPRLELLHPTPRVSIAAVQLPWSHSDPVDRIIVATARELDAPLLTADAAIREAKLVRCLWD